MAAENGIPADQLAAEWRTSSTSSPSGSCIEVAALADETIAAFLTGITKGEFDDLALA